MNNIYGEAVHSLLRREVLSTTVIPQQAHDLARRMSSALETHMNHDNARPKNASGYAAFRHGLELVLSRALILRLQLVAASFSGYEHVIFNPESGAPFDCLSMTAKHGISFTEPQQAAYTIFPGLMVRQRQDGAEFKVVRRADVFARLRKA